MLKNRTSWDTAWKSESVYLEAQSETTLTLAKINDL